jgi:hypothetical protein
MPPPQYLLTWEEKSEYLCGDGVGFADLVAPEPKPDGVDGKLGENDGAPEGGGHLLAALQTAILPNCRSFRCRCSPRHLQ